jgi:hypothetical protein
MNFDEIIKKISFDNSIVKSIIAKTVISEAENMIGFSVESLFLDIEQSIKIMKASGMTKTAVKKILKQDFDNDGRIFSGFKRGIQDVVVKSIGDQAQRSYEHKIMQWDKLTKSFIDPSADFIQNVYGKQRLDRKNIIWTDENFFYDYDIKTKKLNKDPIEGVEKPLYKWVTVKDNKVCPDCTPRHGQVKSMKDWRLIGLPRSGWSVCRSRCRCVLEYEKSIPDGIQEFVRKKV